MSYGLLFTFFKVIFFCCMTIKWKCIVHVVCEADMKLEKVFLCVSEVIFMEMQQSYPFKTLKQS